MNNPEIRYLQHEEIDFEKWDRCIANSENSRVYACSWYMNIMNPDWSGFVYGDYQYVMPLSVKRKFGINYVYQPVYAQQLGIFPPPPANLQQRFLDHLVSKFRYIHYVFNSGNKIQDTFSFVSRRTNLIVPLNEPYPEIFAKYSSHTKRKLKKTRLELTIRNITDVSDYMKIKMEYSGVEDKKDYFNLLQSTGYNIIKEKRGEIAGAYTDDNELCAAAIFLFHGKRIIYLNAVSSPKGKEQKAMYRIIDDMIKRFSASDYILDFEGSSVPGIARFYQGFGAIKEDFCQIKVNRLPWFIRFFKK